MSKEFKVFEYLDKTRAEILARFGGDIGKLFAHLIEQGDKFIEEERAKGVTIGEEIY